MSDKCPMTDLSGATPQADRVRELEADIERERRSAKNAREILIAAGLGDFAFADSEIGGQLAAAKVREWQAVAAKRGAEQALRASGHPAVTVEVWTPPEIPGDRETAIELKTRAAELEADNARLREECKTMRPVVEAAHALLAESRRIEAEGDKDNDWDALFERLREAVDHGKES